MAGSAPQSEHLDERLFKSFKFILSWIGFLTVILLFVSWPLRNIALVCWVYGSQAYFRGGIRVLPGKPIRFSSGAEVPTLPDLVTGFGAFIITVFGLTMLLIFLLRVYERHFSKRDLAA
jgi:hypothetical protein